MGDFQSYMARRSSLVSLQHLNPHIVLTGCVLIQFRRPLLEWSRLDRIRQRKPDYLPVGTVEHSGRARYRSHLVGICLDSKSSVVFDAEQMVHNLESLRASREIDTADIHQSLELTLTVVTQKGQDGNDGTGVDVQCQLVLVDRKLLNELGQACGMCALLSASPDQSQLR